MQLFAFVTCVTYIAPTVDTINTFWQMITENKPLLVVMVTKFIENGKVIYLYI